MRKAIIAVFLGWVASVVTGATLTPVQLLNPAGSTAGQAIVSTGPATAPGWGTVAAGSLPPVAANTVIANATGSSASPTAFAMPSCSATGNNLQYTAATGFTCATGYALLASPTFTGTVTAAALTTTGAFTPSTTAGIVGTTTGNNVNAGSIGEYVTNITAGTSLTSASLANATSISLTAGDWDVACVVTFVPAGSTTTTVTQAGVSLSSATLLPPNSGGFVTNYGAAPAGAGIVLASPTVRITLGATTTTYCVTSAQFAVSTMTASGFIRARRVR